MIIVDVDGNADTGPAVGDTFTSIERYWLGTNSDVFFGSATENTEVWGVEGADNLTTGSGADRLNGGIGDDTLTAGGGADEFVISALGSGADTVTDFQDGLDLIRIYGIGVADEFSDLVVASNGSGGTLITLPDGSTITLTAIDPTDIDASDFIFGAP